MDISATTAPRTDQQNYDNFIAGPKTVTISEVKAGSSEQPIEIHLVEFPGQPYKPSKSMRRVIVSAWGAESSAYTGRRLRLYGDPNVRFGPDVVGGIKISHLSHIDKPHNVKLTVSRGKRQDFTVQPLEDVAPVSVTEVDPVVALEWIAEFRSTTTLAELQAKWTAAGNAGVAGDARLVAAKDAQKKKLT